MRKDALTIVLITAVAGIFGGFLRWLQLLNAFEEDSGLSIPGSATSVVMVLYLALAALVFAALAFFLLKSFSPPRSVSAALRSSTSLPQIISIASGVLAAVTGLVLLFTAHDAARPLGQRIFGACCLFLAAALPGLFAKRGEGPKEKNLAALVPVLFCCVWLAYCYRCHAENPVVWAYVVELLAVVALTLGCYETAAYSYGRAKPGRALFFVQLAAFLCITTLTDERSLPMQLLFVLAAAGMLTAEYLLVENLRSKDTD